MRDLIENLKEISDRIRDAQKLNDYEEILNLDHQRKFVIDEIFSKGIKELSEENIDTIKLLAEENEKMISEISIAGTKKVETAHKRITALKAYNK